MIIKKFPTKIEAEKLGGSLLAPFTFCKIFPSAQISIEEDLVDVNKFLLDNGYEKVEGSQLDKDYLSFTNSDDTLTVEVNPWASAFVVYINDRELEEFYHELRQEGS